jgi:hypothetical protein
MKVVAVVIIILALVIGIVPQFSNCLYEGQTLKLANGTTAPMKCYWSARSEIPMAVLLLGVGILLALSKRKETWRSLFILSIILGAFVMLIPTNLIGVCSSMMKAAACNTVMQPTLLLAGGLVIATGVVGVVFSLRKAEVVP